MMVRLILLLAVAMGFIIYTIAFVRKESAIKRRWRTAFEHVIAILFGWIAFAILLGLLVLLDLFETNKFSFSAFANGLLIPLIIFIGGMILLRVTLIAPDR